jgi:hypothetical protein
MMAHHYITRTGKAVNEFEFRIVDYTRSQALPGNAMQPRLRLDSCRRSLQIRWFPGRAWEPVSFTALSYRALPSRQLPKTQGSTLTTTDVGENASTASSYSCPQR